MPKLSELGQGMPEKEDLKFEEILKARIQNNGFGTDIYEMLADKNLAKKVWNKKDRKELESLLDQDILNFVKSRPKRKVDLPESVDVFAEELKNHPMFMKEVPDMCGANYEMPPLLQGLQDIKYDASINSPEELALSHKESGNQAFKAKNNRLAVICYTHGIMAKCSDQDLNATLYNNRSAAHFELENYRSCYTDCKRALDIKPNYTKTIQRLARVSFELGYWDECIVACEKMKNSLEFDELKEKARYKKKEQLRNERKSVAQEKKIESQQEAVVKAIKERGINVQNTYKAECYESLFSGSFADKKVHLNGDILVWPVLLLYPEHKISDLIDAFPEDTTFFQQLYEVFKDESSWDKEKKYKIDNVNIYYEDLDCKWHRVKLNATLKETLSRKSFYLDGATPTFILFIKDSDAEYKFLKDGLD